MFARARLSLMIVGATVGALAAFAVAPHVRGFFHVPVGGVGATTVLGYPKSWDYAVLALLTIFAALGALAAPRAHAEVIARTPAKTAFVASVAFVLFVTLALAHDHPYSFMDMYHEGEQLTPASIYLDGGRPYRDVFVLHGLAADGGLDALILGNPPSLLRTRRLETILDAAALALLVPIAFELAATTGGAIVALLAGLCAIGASLVPVFPYYRLIPLLIAALALIRYARTRRRAMLWVALLASTLGALWSLDAGLYALGGTLLFLIVAAIDDRSVIGHAAIALVVALLAPFLILLALRADIHHFLYDSFVAIPRSADAIAALPARPLPALADVKHPLDWLASEAARYYLPPVFYGLALVLALSEWIRGQRARAMQIAAITFLSLAAFRTAAGRCSWSHTRYGIPLLGIAVVAFVLEPAVLRVVRERDGRVWRLALLMLIAVPFWSYFEFALNAQYLTKFLGDWPHRLKHEGLVPYPMQRGRGIFTYAQNAADLAAIDAFVQQNAPPGEPILELSGEKALYYFLNRRPAVRCPDVGMLGTPWLRDEALQELRDHPPHLAIVHGQNGLDQLDGVSNRQRAPEIFAWVDQHLPRRQQVGRYTVALPP